MTTTKKALFEDQQSMLGIVPVSAATIHCHADYTHTYSSLHVEQKVIYSHLDINLLYVDSQ